MARIVWLSAFFCLVAMPGIGKSWSGVLVDSKCFTSMDHNRGDIPSFVNWDINGAIQFCSPTMKTHSFAVVQPDGTSIKLDSNGNERSRTLLDNNKHSLYIVKLDGEEDRHMVRVKTISVLRRVPRWDKK